MSNAQQARDASSTIGHADHLAASLRAATAHTHSADRAAVSGSSAAGLPEGKVLHGWEGPNSPTAMASSPAYFFSTTTSDKPSSPALIVSSPAPALPASSPLSHLLAAPTGAVASSPLSTEVGITTTFHAPQTFQTSTRAVQGQES